MHYKGGMKEFHSRTVFETDFSVTSTDFNTNTLQATVRELRGRDLYDVAYYNHPSTNEKVITQARILLNDVNARFAMIRWTLLEFGGTVGEVDCQSKQLKLYADWNGISDPMSGIIVAHRHIDYDFEAGKEYVAVLETDIHVTKLRIIDAETNEASELVFDQESVAEGAAGVGRQWGKPGVMFHSGQLTVIKLEFISALTREPRILILGDSLVEGWNTYPSFSARWASMLRDELTEVVIAGRGGESSSSMKARIQVDLESFRPLYILLQLGTNDSDYDTWISAMSSHIHKAQDIGAIPILGTLPPKCETQSFINQANAYIRASGYRFVDFAKALTVGNDGVTWKPDVVNTDGVHPNALGHRMMLDQLRLDLPELFN